MFLRFSTLRIIPDLKVWFLIKFSSSNLRSRLRSIHLAALVAPLLLVAACEPKAPILQETSKQPALVSETDTSVTAADQPVKITGGLDEEVSEPVNLADDFDFDGQLSAIASANNSRQRRTLTLDYLMAAWDLGPEGYAEAKARLGQVKYSPNE